MAVLLLMPWELVLDSQVLSEKTINGKITAVDIKNQLLFLDTPNGRMKLVLPGAGFELKRNNETRATLKAGHLILNLQAATDFLHEGKAQLASSYPVKAKYDLRNDKLTITHLVS